MGIGGISDYSHMFSNYKVPEIPSVNFDQLKKTQNQETVKPQETVSRDIDLTIEERKTPKPEALDVKDISLTFNAGEDFGYIGKDSDIQDLDMQKAISDMKKDQVLQQYQYFVGNAENLFPKNESEDGFVFLKF